MRTPTATSGMIVTGATALFADASWALSIANQLTRRLPPFPAEYWQEFDMATYRNVFGKQQRIQYPAVFSSLEAIEQRRAKASYSGALQIFENRSLLPVTAWFGAEGIFSDGKRPLAQGVIGDIVGLMAACRDTSPSIDVGLVSISMRENEIAALIGVNEILRTYVSMNARGTYLVRDRVHVVNQAKKLASSSNTVDHDPSYGMLGALVRFNGSFAIHYPVAPFLEAGEIMIAVRQPHYSALVAFISGIDRETPLVRKVLEAHRHTYAYHPKIWIPWKFDSFLDGARLFARPSSDDERVPHRNQSDEYPACVSNGDGDDKRNVQESL